MFLPGQPLPQIKFRLLRPNTITPNDFLIVESHFSDLNLLSRYSKRVVPILSVQLEKLRDSYRNKAVNLAVLINEMLRERNKKAQEFGVNYFEAAVFEAMANSLEFIDLL